MKLRNLLLGVSMAAALLAGCKDDGRLSGEPSLTLSPAELAFEESAAATQTITLSTTREWAVKGTLPEWMDINPVSGEAAPEGITVEVTVTENQGTDRSASVDFTIGTITRTLAVSQKGEGGAAVGGDGTLESPYSVAEALAFIQTLGADVESKEVYLKGLVSSFKGDVAADIEKYGSISYYVSDDGSENGTLLVYAGKYFNGDKFTSAEQLSIKDELIICGKLINFKGNTPEVTMGNRIVSHNGETGGDAPDPGEFVTTPISEILGLPEGAVIGEKIGIEGIIVSNADLNNLTSKKGAYVQDETGGLQLRFSSDHSFKFGDKVKINLSGAKKGAYNMAVQVEVSNSMAACVSSGEKVESKAVSVADFLANKYEGQYIALENVQVAVEELEKTFVVGGNHTSIKFEDKDGNNFIVFSSKYSKFAAESVPQGAGTLKGIASRNNDDIQIIFAQDTDWSGLTGTRFGNSNIFSVSPMSLNVSADAESATFKVNGNVSWTASVTEGSDFVEILYGESGTGAGDVVLQLTKNESEESARTAKITVSTTADVAKKEYVFTLTQAKKSSGATGDGTPITWTLGENAYDNSSSGNNQQSATINGESRTDLLKLGTSKNAGTATLKIPAGTKKVGFYGVCWKGKTASIKCSAGGTEIGSQALAANAGATGNAPYTMTVTESDYYEITVPIELTSDTDVTVESVQGSDCRAILFGIVAYK